MEFLKEMFLNIHLSSREWSGLIGGLLALFFLFRFYTRKSRKYRKTEYYHQTKVGFAALRADAGRSGEYSIYALLKKKEAKLPGHPRYLFNCYLPKPDGSTTEVDVLLLHETGIYVFESKNYQGFIYGHTEERMWTETPVKDPEDARRVKFYNPLKQNEGHIRWLKKMLKDEKPLQFYSYIVFGNRARLKTRGRLLENQRLLNTKKIFRRVRKDLRKNPQIFDEAKIQRMYELLYPCTQMNRKEKADHAEDMEMRETLARYIPVRICPECGGRLYLRRVKKGPSAGETFYGCENYPRCRYTEDNEQ